MSADSAILFVALKLIVCQDYTTLYFKMTNKVQVE